MSTKTRRADMPKDKPAAADRRAEIEPPAPFAEIFEGADKIGEIRFGGRSFMVMIEVGGTHLKWIGAVAKRADAIALVRLAHLEFWKCLTAACSP